MRGSSQFHASSVLPTLVFSLSVQCRAWKWRARAGNELVELFSLQHTLEQLAVCGTVHCP